MGVLQVCYIKTIIDWANRLIGAYCTDIDKKLSISQVISELLLHYFIYCESFSFEFPILTVKPPLPGEVPDEA